MIHINTQEILNMEKKRFSLFDLICLAGIMAILWVAVFLSWALAVDDNCLLTAYEQDQNKIFIGREMCIPDPNDPHFICTPIGAD